MENNNNIWECFFKNLPILSQAILPHAKRSGISTDSAILLTIYSEFPDISIPVREELVEELKCKGLISVGDGRITVTSKGAILAKAFKQIRDTIF